MRTSTTRQTYDVRGNVRDESGSSGSDDDDVRGAEGVEGEDEEGGHSRRGERRPFIADVEYENEVGYSLIRAFRGRNTGRRLKRDIFKQGVSQIVVSVGMIIFTDHAARDFRLTNFFDTSTYGTRLLSLWWLTCIIGFIISFVTFFIVYLWPSLVTNRVLLNQILKIYMLINFVNWIFVLATAITTLRTFGEYPRYDITPYLLKLQPYYIASVLFLVPYLLCVCCNLLNVSYLNDELEFGGSLYEPDAPEDTWDLSGMSLEDFAKAVVAYPIAVALQTLELLLALYNLALRLWRRLRRYLEDRWQRYQQELAREEKGKKKRRGLIARILKTITRWFATLLICLRGGGAAARYKAEDEQTDAAKAGAGAGAGGSSESEQALRILEQEKEAQERMERERHEMELERQKQRELEDRVRREAEELARQDKDRRRREKEEEEEKRRKEELEKLGSPILSVSEFKAMWSELAVAGQFQCKLRENPELIPFTEHLRKQGFHIVFASVPSPSDVEVGVCNVRDKSEDPRFMARFLSTSLAFSAVMKCESAEAVPPFVKKFALAKILKIDTKK